MCFLNQQNEFLAKQLNLSINELMTYFNEYKTETLSRGEFEIQYWENKITEIKKYSREEAIVSLLKSLKLNEKINTIQNFMKDLKS